MTTARTVARSVASTVARPAASVGGGGASAALSVGRTFAGTTSDYIKFRSGFVEGTLHGASVVSISAWVRFDGSGTRPVFSGVVGSNVGIELGINSSGQVYASGRSAVGDTLQSTSGATTLTAGQWYHLSAVLNIAGDSITVYVNGTQDGTGSVTFANTTYTFTSPTGNARIGGDVGGSNAFNGSVCDLALYRYALGSTELSALAAGTRPDQLTVGPTCYWPLDDATDYGGVGCYPRAGGVVGWSVGDVSIAATKPSLASHSTKAAWQKFDSQLRVMRLQASSANSVGVGNAVSSVTLQGAGASATQSSTARPTLQTASSRSVLRFDGSDDSLTLPLGAVLNSRGVTVVALVDVGSGGSGGDGRILSGAISGGSTELSGFAVTANAGLSVGGPTVIASSTYSDYTAGTTGLGLLSGRWSGAECKNWLNGAARNGTVANSTEYSDGSFRPGEYVVTFANSFAIGRRPVGTGTFAAMDLVDMIVIVGEVTDEEVQFFEGVLAWENSATSLLPSGHTYKSTQPTLGTTISYPWGDTILARTYDAANILLASPGICERANGDKLVIHDDTGDSVGRLMVLKSGKTAWGQLCEIPNLYWPTIWEHADGNLYIIGTTRNWGDLKILKSTTDGRTWTSTTLSNGTLLAAAGSGTTAPNYHRGGGLKPLYKDGYIFFACENNADSPATFFTGFRSFVLYAQSSADLMTASNWAVTSQYQLGTNSYSSRVHPSSSVGFLEGNITEDVDGTIYVILRFVSSTPDTAVLIPMTWNGSTISYPTWSTSFFDSVSGGNVKFEIIKDGVTHLMLGNKNTANPSVFSSNRQDQRNRLELLWSQETNGVDQFDFRRDRVLIDEATLQTYTGMSAVDSVDFHGFQYSSIIKSGTYLHAAYRVGWSGANSFHDSNLIGYGKISIDGPTNTVAPVISGTAYPLETLTLTQGTWSNATSYSYQWYVNGTARDGATSTTFQPLITDIGAVVFCIETATNSAGSKFRKSNPLTIWKPTDITAVKAFWLAGMNTYNSVSPNVAATDAQAVRQWVDISSNAFAADQTTGANQPLLQVAEINGSSVVELDGTNDTFTTGATSVFRAVNYGYVIAAVKDTNNAGGSTNHYPFFATGGTGSGRMVLNTRSSGNFSAGFRTLDADSFVSASTTNDGNWHVLTAEGLYAQGLGRLRVDGSQVASSALASTGTTSNTASTYATIGSQNSGANTFFPGQLAVLLLVSGASQLTSTERSQLERYAGLLIGKDIPLV